MPILTPVAAGNNRYGKLGLGNDANEMGDALPAVSLGANLTATAIASGDHHNCALLSNGQLKCWG